MITLEELRTMVLEVLADNKVHTRQELIAHAEQKFDMGYYYSDQRTTSAIISLIKKGELFKLEKGIYQLHDESHKTGMRKSMTDIEKMHSIKTMIEQRTNGQQKFVKADTICCDNDSYISLNVKINNNYVDRIGIGFSCNLRRIDGDKTSAEMQAICDEIQTICDLLKEIENESISLSCNEFMEVSSEFSEEKSPIIAPQTLLDKNTTECSIADEHDEDKERKWEMEM